MIPGFHTISLLLHDEVTAIEQLAVLGFKAVAIRPRLSGLHLSLPDFDEQAKRIADAAEKHQLELVLDLSGSFLEDPFRARGSSLVSTDTNESSRAAQSLKTWIDVSPLLSVKVISFSSGPRTGDVAENAGGALERLAHALEPLLHVADANEVRLAVRPATADVIGSVAQYERFLQWLSPDSSLSVAPDVGEMLLGGEFPVGERLARHHRRMACLYLCEPESESEQARDQRIGRGDIDLMRVWGAVEASGFDGPAIFRVFGHSERGLDLASETIQMLQSPH
ncbi:sugar phosphate isomerase/epimerase family protein [Stieleria varia]|uniref:Xylose isomerase-like TIM barrel n=1 Tax=Stieleria varia TaxID=2528005 RepID=A0A5C6BC55_9BACT|nr:TIM barrel protein [Stieleria varia]TWU08114.1 Xylose isomerase-like TIM barrel [Stieleria varia]